MSGRSTHCSTGTAAASAAFRISAADEASPFRSAMKNGVAPVLSRPTSSAVAAAGSASASSASTALVAAETPWPSTFQDRTRVSPQLQQGFSIGIAAVSRTTHLRKWSTLLGQSFVQQVEAVPCRHAVVAAGVVKGQRGDDAAVGVERPAGREGPGGWEAFGVRDREEASGV